MVPVEQVGPRMMQDALHPAMAASLESLHSFFSKSRLPEAPLTEDDIALYMLLVTYSDALDALPLEFTRSFSDLRELDAVLGDVNVTPGERLLALKEVAEEARAYKMGGEDKIRVSMNTAETTASHAEYIDSLLYSLTSLPALAPYMREYRPRMRQFGGMDARPLPDERAPMPPPGAFPNAESSMNARRSRKAAASNEANAPQASEAVSRARARDFSDAPRNAKKRKTMPQVVANGKGRGALAESASHDRSTRPNGTSAVRKRGEVSHRRADWENGEHDSEDGGEFYGNHTHNARVNRTRDRPANNEMDGWGGRAGNDGSQPNSMPGGRTNSSDQRSVARSRTNKTSSDSSQREDADDVRYCFCNNVSYGDMIGCDDDDCEREWFHLGCVGLSKPPQGTWYCDACLERRANQARNKPKRGGGARPIRTHSVTGDLSNSSRRVATSRR